MMKSIEKKMMMVEERVSKLKNMSQKINSFEGYISSQENIDIAERNIARKNKEWKKADEIREKLKKSGIILKDYPQGTLWTVERKEKT